MNISIRISILLFASKENLVFELYSKFLLEKKKKLKRKLIAKFRLSSEHFTDIKEMFMNDTRKITNNFNPA